MFSHEMEERAGAGMGIWNGSTWRTINTKGTDVEFDPYFDGLAHTRRRTRVDGSSAALDRVASDRLVGRLRQRSRERRHVWVRRMGRGQGELR